jgi:hypothetical protein
VKTYLYGQEINPETYAICKADMLLKGEGENADHIIGGAEHSTLSHDAFPAKEFDFMLSNPPYGKSWKKDLEEMGGKDKMRDPRFKVEHAGQELSLVTRSSDGQLLFLANMVSKMNRKSKLGSRIAEVHNGSSLFTGDAGQGESNIRRWLIENDWLEAIVALPPNMFYNTGSDAPLLVRPKHRSWCCCAPMELLALDGWNQRSRQHRCAHFCESPPARARGKCVQSEARSSHRCPADGSEGRKNAGATQPIQTADAPESVSAPTKSLLTFSALNTFRNCPRKYKLRYVDCLRPREKAETLSFGGVIRTAASIWTTASIQRLASSNHGPVTSSSSSPATARSAHLAPA